MKTKQQKREEALARFRILSPDEYTEKSKWGPNARPYSQYVDDKKPERQHLQSLVNRL